VVYITTPAIPSCFVSFFSDPYSSIENFQFFNSSWLVPFCVNLQTAIISQGHNINFSKHVQGFW